MNKIYIINYTNTTTRFTYEKYYYSKDEFMTARRHLNSLDNVKINKAMGNSKYKAIKLLDIATNQRIETLLKVVTEASGEDFEKVLKGYQEQYKNNSYVKVIVK